MHRHALRDREWDKLHAVLPPAFGRPAKLELRNFLNAVLWKVRTGVPWRDLPERYGPWKTVYSKFRRWARAGHFTTIFEALQIEVDDQWNAIDGSYVRAHHHSAGAKGGPNPQLLAFLEEAVPPSSMRALMRKADLSRSRSRQATSTTARRRRH